MLRWLVRLLNVLLCLVLVSKLSDANSFLMATLSRSACLLSTTLESWTQVC